MANILIGWELGAGLGHVTRLMKIARGLAVLGHQPILALRNLVEPWPAYRDAEFPILQAPMYQARPGPRRRSSRASAISDIFGMLGFDNPDELLPMVHAWQNIIDITHPALIVSDYSPTLCLAAFGVEPMVIVGDGFTVPPHDLAEFPTLRPEAQPTINQNRMLKVVQEVQRRRGRPTPKALPEIFAAEACYACCHPELDPYRAERSLPAIGPFDPPSSPSPLPKENGYFAYIASDYKRFKAAVLGIGEIDLAGEIFIRRAPRNTIRYLREKGLYVFDKPAPIVEVLRNASAIVHHGGIGTTEVAVAVGRPQVLLTRHLEQNLTGSALEELGVGVVLRGDYQQEDLIKTVHRVVEDPGYGERAQEFAATIQERGTTDNVARIVEGCQRIINFGRAEPVV